MINENEAVKLAYRIANAVMVLTEVSRELDKNNLDYHNRCLENVVRNAQKVADSLAGTTEEINTVESLRRF